MRLNTLISAQQGGVLSLVRTPSAEELTIYKPYLVENVFSFASNSARDRFSATAELLDD